MSKSATEASEKPHEANERLVYVLPRDALGGDADEISLLDLWNVLWAGKWLGAATMCLAATVAITYVLLATEVYRAEMLLAPAGEGSTQGSPSQLGALAGIASLAGFSVGGGGNAVPLAVLQSRAFIQEFIEERGLMPILFADRWDEERRRWIVDEIAEAPDVRDGVKLVLEGVLTVSEETATGLVELNVDWTDPELASDWANDLVARLNDRMRQHAQMDAQRNVDYLKEQLGSSSLVTLQQSIGRLLETEMQNLMLARGNEEFAFRVIDPAQVPKDRIAPDRMRVLAIAVIAGSILSLLLIAIHHLLWGRSAQGRPPSTAREAR